MKTHVMSVTPAMAEKWLQRNTINRPIRMSVVEGYLAAYRRGEYKLTHQGIAFATDGALLDGQHRLTALTQMPQGFSLQMMVTTDMPPDSFKAIDLGLRRSNSDVLRVPQGLAAVARYLAVLNDQRHSSISPQLLMSYINPIEDCYDKLVSFCPTVTKTWSSAAVRSAAILQMMAGGDKDYICITYYALNHAEFDSMSQIAKVLYRQHIKGATKAKAVDMFCRSFKAFDHRNAGLGTIQISDTSTIVSRARSIVQERVLCEKKAGTKAAPANQVNRANSTARKPIGIN